MLIKKIGSLLLALTLIIACIPGTMVTAADAAWFDIEVESGTLGSAGGHSADATTGRGYIVAYQSVHAGNNATNTFTRESEGKYDVWAVVGTAKGSDGANRGGYTFTLDTNDEIGSVYMDDAYDVSASDALYSVPNIASVSVEMRWVKIASNKTIAPGEHSLLSAITRSKNHENNKMGVIDVVRFVPSSWNWTPASNFDAPTIPEWIHIEAEDGTYAQTSYTVVSNANYSGGKVLRLVDTVETSATEITFSAAVPATDKYDVLILANLYDYSASAWNVKIGDSTYTPTRNLNVGQLYGIGAELGYNLSMGWIRLARNVDLTEGTVSISANVPTKQRTDYYFAGIDAIRLVPSSWDWPADSIGAPEKVINVPDKNGVILVEAERGILDGSMKFVSRTDASKGRYASVTSTQTVGSSTSKLHVEEDGSYDIWGAVGTLDANYLGGYNFTLDGVEIYNQCLSAVPRTNPGLYGGDIILHSDVKNVLATVRWVKLETGKSIGAGDHTLVLATRKGNGANNTVGLIDCVALVPTGVKFDKTSIVPSYTIPDYYDLEAEEGNLTYNLTDSATVGGYTHGYVYTDNNNSKADNKSEMTFVSKGGKYDIWAVVGVDNYPDGTSPRLCYYDFKLDGTTFAKPANLITLVPTYNPFYTRTMQNVEVGAHWIKLAEDLEIAEGARAISGAITKCAVPNTVGYIDKIRIVPSSWNHVPTDIATAPVAPEVLYGSFTLSDKAEGATATATVTGIKKTVDAEKNAVVIVAVYKNDTLVEVVPSAITALTTEAQTISAPVTLPADITGVTVKAFLWDGLSAAMPYADDIEK